MSNEVDYIVKKNYFRNIYFLTKKNLFDYIVFRVPKLRIRKIYLIILF